MKKIAWLVFMLIALNASAQTHLKAVEYYLGNDDPGEGNGIAIQTSEGSFDEVVEALFKDSVLLSGYGNTFLFNIRAKDAANHWGPIFKKPINIASPIAGNGGVSRAINITAAEYFFGTSDPGEGNGNILLAFDGAFDEALEAVIQQQVSINGYGNSFLLNARMKDADNHWGPIFKKPINIASLIVGNDGSSGAIKITAAEYFFGTSDPGEGNGNTLLAFDGAFDEALEVLIQQQVSINGYGNSFLLNVRMKDADNHWGSIFKKPINIASPTSSNGGVTHAINITAAEYFFGTSDPGEGNANALLVFDGAFDEALETVFKDSVFMNHPSGGNFLLNVRAKDATQHWGALYKKVIRIPVSVSQLIAEGDTLKVCPQAIVTLHYQGPAGFSPHWSNNSTFDSTIVSAVQSGYVTVTAQLGNETYFDSIYLFVSPMPYNFFPTDSILSCGTFYTLAATAGNITYNWNTGDTSQSIVVSNSNWYKCVVTNNEGCAARDSVFVTVNSLPVVIAASSAGSVCAGSSVTLTGIGATYYTWSGGVTNGVSFIPSSSETYTVIGVDANGCTASASQYVQVNDVPSVQSCTNQHFCYGQSVATALLSGSPAGVTFDISGGASIGLANQTAVSSIPSFTATSVGTSIITITPMANGCVGASSTYTLTVTNCGNVTVHLKLFLHGYYDNNGLMQKVLYNQSVVSDPASVLADSVTVELHEATYPYSMMRTTSALLHTNGTLTCSFPDDVLGTPYYISIHHRNTIETWSAAPMTITPDMTYDFSAAASKAYANNQVDVSGNGTIWAMFTADLNQDQNVDLLDMLILEDDIALYMYGYAATDLNGDGNTDLLDVIYLDYGIANYVFSYHP